MQTSTTTVSTTGTIPPESPLSEAPEEILQEAKPKEKRQPRKRKADEKPKRQMRKRKTSKPADHSGEELVEAVQKPKHKRKAAALTTAAEGEGKEKPKKKRRRKTPEEDKVYDIPPIENVLNTTFKGRLGYACLNTVLRSYSTPVFCSRTCRLSTLVQLGAEHLRSLALQNLADLHTLVKWNAEHNIYFMRMSSEMFPFASHPVHGYDLSFADEELKAVGKTARELGVRLTSHPGQFTQLGSPTKKVVENAVRDLSYHCEMMDRMGLDKDSVMIIHMGGMFGDKLATLERFKENYTNLSENIKGRLVLENDEMCYNVDDLLPICRELRIPLVFDYHHDWIYPSSRAPAELIPEINQLWHDKGIRPKQHLSEPRPGAQTVMEKRAHSDRVARLPDALPDDMDLMLECKDKEQAVFYLYRLYGLREVDARVLRPAAAEESLHTKGRKSTKRARAKAAAATEAEGLAAVDSDDRLGEDTELGGPAHEDEARVELEREGEDHGVPPNEAEAAVAEVEAIGGLDCVSGDGAAVDVCASPRRDTQKQGRQRAGRAKGKAAGQTESRDQSGIAEEGGRRRRNKAKATERA